MSQRDYLSENYVFGTQFQQDIVLFFALQEQGMASMTSDICSQWRMERSCYTKLMKGLNYYQNFNS